MTSPSEQFNALYRAQMQAAQDYADLAMKETQRIFKLQMDAVQSLFSMGGGESKASSAVSDPVKTLANWPALVQGDVQQRMEAARTYLEAAAKVQGELAQQVANQMTAINKMWLDAMQGFLGTSARRTHESAESRANKKA